MQIPMGNTGNATAAPGRAINVAAPAGRAVEGIGEGMARQNAIAEHEAKRVEHERLQEQKRIAAEDKHARDTADAAQASAHLGIAKDRLRDTLKQIGDGMTANEIDKRKAPEEWERRSKEAVQEALQQIPESHRPVASIHLEGARTQMRSGVDDLVRGRDRQDTATSLDAILENSARMYRTDPKQAAGMMAGALDKLGPAAGMAPDQIGKKKQAWHEAAEFSRATEALSAGRTNGKALQAAEKLIAESPNLDPQKRASLHDRAQTYRLHHQQQAEMAANRAERENDRRMKKAEASFTAANALADKGILSTEYAEKVIAETSGTPYQAAFKTLIDTQRETAPLAMQPPAKVRAAVDALNTDIADKGTSPEKAKRLARYEGVLRGQESDIAKDPLRAYGERHGDIPPPIDTSSLNGVVAGMKERAVIAQRAAAWSGKPAAPLLAEEIEPVRKMFETLPPRERATGVAMLSGVLGPQASQGLAAQLDKTDKALSLAFALGGQQTIEGRLASEFVLKGAQAMKDGTSTKGEKSPDVKPAKWKADIAAQLDGIFPAQTMTDRAREAALYIAHGVAAEQQGALSEKGLAGALELAIGGSIDEVGRHRTFIPAGMKADDIEKRMKAVTPAEIGGDVRVGGVPMSAADFVKTLPGQRLMYAGPGKYAVIVGDRPVVNAQGKPVLIGVR